MQIIFKRQSYKGSLNHTNLVNTDLVRDIFLTNELRDDFKEGITQQIKVIYSDGTNATIYEDVPELAVATFQKIVKAVKNNVPCIEL